MPFFCICTQYPNGIEIQDIYVIQSIQHLQFQWNNNKKNNVIKELGQNKVFEQET